MKKFTLLLLFLTIAIVGRAQKITEDPFFIICMNDTLTIHTTITRSNTVENIKYIFGKYRADKTKDDIYFYISPTSYILYVPELYTVFNVQCTTCSYSVSEHFIWLLTQIREKKPIFQQYINL